MAKTSSLAGGSGTVRATLQTAAIVPDECNRQVVEDDDFIALCDSVRLCGVLQAIQVWRRPDGSHRIIDGERRWRAARKVGVSEIVCDVWPAEAEPRRVAVAGLVLNEHRKAHGCIQVARRLRDIKNESGLTHSGLAEHTGLPLDRVKTYFSLFAASDDLLTFLERHEIPLKVAVELARYERATNEARARRLIERHKESPLTVNEIAALRKRDAHPLPVLFVARQNHKRHAAPPVATLPQAQADCHPVAVLDLRPFRRSAAGTHCRERAGPGE